MFPAIWSQQGTCVLGIRDKAGDASALPSLPPQPEYVRSPLSLPALSTAFGHINWEHLVL